MYWRRFALSDIPLENKEEFEQWLLARWREKDDLLEEFYDTGRFPTSLASSINVEGGSEDQKQEAANGYIETTIRLGHWTEIGQLFIVVTAVGMLLRLVLCS